MSRPDPNHVPVYVSYMAPLPAHSHDYAQFKSGMSSWLAQRHNIEALSVVQGSGADLSASRPEKRGDRHGQVSILYGIPDGEIDRLLLEKEPARAMQDTQHDERAQADVGQSDMSTSPNATRSAPSERRSHPVTGRDGSGVPR
jgi:hypothetical protein